LALVQVAARHKYLDVSRYTMTALHDNKREIEALQTRYKAMNGIDLTKDQAEKVFLYEQEKNSGASKYFFSIWEELDYEEVKFREILTSSQFESYMSKRPIQLMQIEESLIENDKQYLPQLNAAEERLDYYKNILVPSLRKNLMLFYTVFNSEKEKVDFLKGLLQGWLDIGAIGHFIAVVLHLGWTYIVGLLFVNLYFYIFNQQRFRADEQ
jgi:hypothetical protein